MTRKEIAIELYQKYESLGRDFTRGVSMKEHSKQCALIAVDTTINTLNHDIRDLDVRGSVLLDLIKYWREVREEIEKL